MKILYSHQGFRPLLRSSMWGCKVRKCEIHLELIILYIRYWPIARSVLASVSGWRPLLNPCVGWECTEYQICCCNCFPWVRPENAVLWKAVVDPGEGPPIIFGPNWSPKGHKKFWGAVHPTLSQGLDDRPPPLGLKPPLKSYFYQQIDGGTLYFLFW